MVEAHDWSLRPHAQQATRPSPTTQADMRPESQRRKRSSFIKAKLMLRLSFFFFLENQAARECGRRRTSRVSNRTRRGPKKMRPWNDTQAKAHGTKPSVEPQDEMLKSVQNWPRVWHFFRTSAAKPASPSLQLNIPQVDSLRRYARFLLHLKNTTFEAHFEQIQEPARKTPQRKKARVARCAAQQWLE